MIDRRELGRFELAVGEDVVFAAYRRQGDLVQITHVEAPPHLRGKGRAAELMTQVVDHARSEKLRIRPLCSYAAAWFRRHRDASDVLA